MLTRWGAVPIDDCNKNCHVFELHSRKAENTKMIVPIFKRHTQWYTFLVNSQPSRFLANNPRLAHLNILLAQHLHPLCLSHDSYLSIHSNNIEIFSEAAVEAATVKCVLNPVARAAMAAAIAGSNELRTKTKRLMVVALTQMGLKVA